MLLREFALVTAEKARAGQMQCAARKEGRIECNPSGPVIIDSYLNL